MELSVIQIILIFIWSSITGMGSVLDEFQTHRPLVACTVTGLILGDVTTGIILGGTLELIALGWMNIGAAQSPDSALASVISTILVVVGHQDIQKGIAIALPVAVAGQVLTVLVRTVTVAIQHAADKGAEKANFNRIIALHFFSLVFQAMRVAIPATLVAVFVDANAITRLLDAIPEVITRRVRSVATTKQRVKILYFKHFFKHFVFIEKSDFDIKKVQKKYIDVNVCLDVDCVDKK